MLIESKEILEQILAEGTLERNQAKPGRLLLCSPEYFRIEYAINPYMKSVSGELNEVDEREAVREWQALKNIYEKLGLKVEVIAGVKEFPDMVFNANQSFPFRDKQGRKSVILSNMRSPQRRGEVPYFRDWYEKQGYIVHEIANKKIFFEGNGDALIQYPYNLVWGGYGHRTSRAVYEDWEQRFGLHVVPLELKNEKHYHLDLCLSILGEDCAVIEPSAFTDEGLELIHLGFSRVIEVNSTENLKFACGNCHSPDGKHVILQRGAERFVRELGAQGFEPIEVDTREFLKSGGSVFCLKMMVF